MAEKKVIISSDSTTDLSPELIERYNVHIKPLEVVMGDKSYIDGVEATPDDLYEYAERTGTLAKTSATGIGEHIEFFEEMTKDGSELVYLTISSSMSANNNNARLAAEEVPGVYVVDTKNLSTGGGLLVIAAAELAKKGLSAAEIAEKVSALADYVDASFVVDDLKYLAKGGRCSAVAALGANLLKLKPCIVVKDGSMGVEKKYRGNFATVLKTYIDERLTDADNIDKTRVFVTHAGVDKEVLDACVEQVKKALPWGEVFATRAGCTVSAHCGRNTLGVLFVHKNDIV
ncbi:MAG: DegV family protein [Clostridia bacterium]|nr:DegV family protein [Clostridia bacterium]